MKILRNYPNQSDFFLLQKRKPDRKRNQIRKKSAKAKEIEGGKDDERKRKKQTFLKVEQLKCEWWNEVQCGIMMKWTCFWNRFKNLLFREYLFFYLSTESILMAYWNNSIWYLLVSKRSGGITKTRLICRVFFWWRNVYVLDWTFGKRNLSMRLRVENVIYIEYFNLLPFLPSRENSSRNGL